MKILSLVICLTWLSFLGGCSTPTYCHPSMVEADGGGIYFQRDEDGGGMYFQRDGGGMYFQRDESDGRHQGICLRGVEVPAD